MIYRYNVGCCCVGSLHDGWWFGGAAGSFDKHVYGMVFSTDTTDSATTTLMAIDRKRHASLTHQDDSVYLCAGDFGSNVFTSTIVDGEKFSISTETSVSSTALRLTERSWELAAVSQRSTKGYFAGGTSMDSFSVSQVISTAWKVTFSSETVATQSSADLSQARFQVVGLTEGTDKGYFCGGESTASGNWVDTVDKITFSSDSTSASTSASLPEVRGSMNQSGVSDGSTKGYVCGGVSASGQPPVDTVFKVTFSGDTTANLTSATMSIQRHVLAGMSEGSTKGYVSGGRTFGGGTDTEVTDKITFSSDSVAAVTTADLPAARIFHTGSSAIGL